MNESNLLPSFSSDRWQTWTPRAELSPQFDKVSLDDEICLRIVSNGKYQSYGSWRCEVPILHSNQLAYRLNMEYRMEQTNSDLICINVIYTWIDRNGGWLQRGYIDPVKTREKGWNRISELLRVPEGAHKISIELEFRWSSVGSVIWRRPSMIHEEEAPPRKVKLATTYYFPEKGTEQSRTINVQQVLQRIEQAGKAGADLICISEALCSRCTDPNNLFRDPPESIPGFLTALISAKAKEFEAYIVFNLDERDGECVYNTSLLIGRDGQIVGKYRKVHLPLAEAQLGFTPGDDYPVFETDIGKIGLLICWDQMFPEASRILRLRGAEIICLSTAGEAVASTVARAFDNGVYLVVAGTDGERPSRIINPIGDILCEIKPGDPSEVACIEIDLNRRFYRYWESVGPALGEMRSLYYKERRPDTYLDLVLPGAGWTERYLG